MMLERIFRLSLVRFLDKGVIVSPVVLIVILQTAPVETKC